MFLFTFSYKKASAYIFFFFAVIFFLERSNSKTSPYHLFCLLNLSVLRAASLCTRETISLTKQFCVSLTLRPQTAAGGSSLLSPQCQGHRQRHHPSTNFYYIQADCENHFRIVGRRQRTKGNPSVSMSSFCSNQRFPRGRNHWGWEQALCQNW